MLVEVDAVHVNQVNPIPGEGAIDRRLKPPAVPATIGLADQSTFGHRGCEELARHQRPCAGHDEGTLTLGNEGSVELSQDSFRAADSERSYRSKRKRHTQNRQGHTCYLAAQFVLYLAQQPRMVARIPASLSNRDARLVGRTLPHGSNRPCLPRYGLQAKTPRNLRLKRGAYASYNEWFAWKCKTTTSRRDLNGGGFVNR